MRTLLSRALVCWWAIGLGALHCGRWRSEPASIAEGADASHLEGHTTVARAFEPPWPEPPTEGEGVPAPRKGMIWIPPGTLTAGTPRDYIPRIADEELPGDRIQMSGFFIDVYPYPNEPGAIARTGMNRDEAVALCALQDKRLCTELEWERACKGPKSTIFEYGDTYRANECATGVRGRVPPSGLLVGCKSDFGVHDMHGGAWEWTSSAWSRGAPQKIPDGGVLGVLRGGNGEPGEIVGRCANAIGRAVNTKRSDVGVRCCAGELNRAEVKLPITRGKTLEPRALEPELVHSVEQSLAQLSPADLPIPLPLQIDRLWRWHPLGNEELLVVALYCRKPEHMISGVVVLRPGTEPMRFVAFASSGWWLPVLRTDPNGRDLWVYGGDNQSGLRMHVSYLWGRVTTSGVMRKTPVPAPAE